MALAAVGLVMLALWHDEPWQIVVGMVVLGAGVPFTFAAIAKIIVDSVRPTETGGLDPSQAELYESLWRRHSSRLPFTGEPLSPVLCAELATAAAVASGP